MESSFFIDEANRETQAVSRNHKPALTKPTQVFEIEERNPTDALESTMLQSDSRSSGVADRIRAYILRSGPARDHNFRSPRRQGQAASRFHGWRVGVFAAIITAGICLCAEIALLATAYSRYGPDADGIGRIYSGPCDRAKNLATVLLIPVNLIGTVIIASTNYLVQCLLAPTRREVNKIHERGRYLSVGVSSFRNMAMLFDFKRCCCALLLICAAPVHLLLNSVLFTTVSASDYGVLVLSSDFVEDSSWDKCADILHSPEDEFGQPVSPDGVSNHALDWACQLRQKAVDDRTKPDHSRAFTTLSPQECITKYSNPFDIGAGNVILVTSSTNTWATISSGIEDKPLDIVGTNGEAIHNSSSPYTLRYHPESGSGSWLANDPACEILCNERSLQIPTGSLNTYAGNAIAMNGSSVSDPAWEIQSLRSMWNSYRYQFWIVGQGVNWDLSAPSYTLANSWQPASWLCDADHIRNSGQCTLSKASTNASHWTVTPSHLPIDHCISERLESRCELAYSSKILSLLVAFDVVKFIPFLFMIYTTFIKKIKDEDLDEPLVTVGDAVASFLRNPDDFTKGKCLVDMDITEDQDASYAKKIDRANIPCRPSNPRTGPTEQKRLELAGPIFREAPLPWTLKSLPWRSAPSQQRWLVFCLLYFFIISSAMVLFAFCVQKLGQSNALSEWTAFGELNARTLFTNIHTNLESGSRILDPESRLNRANSIYLRTAVKLNLPQLLFSILYYQYNTIFTSMVAAKDWGNFVKYPEGRTLRVTTPSGLQRSTYWLSLPWTVSIPLIAISGLMHWLLSRAIFMVRIVVYSLEQTQDSTLHYTGIGFSVLAIVLVIVILVLMALVLLRAGTQRLPSGIPVVGNNSRAISNMCHNSIGPWNGDGVLDSEDAALFPLRWGVIFPGDGRKEYPGHCSLTSGPVAEPVPGKFYA